MRRAHRHGSNGSKVKTLSRFSHFGLTLQATRVAHAMGIVPTTGFWPLFSPLLKGATKTDGNIFQAKDKLEQFEIDLSLKPSGYQLACASS